MGCFKKGLKHIRSNQTLANQTLGERCGCLFKLLKRWFYKRLTEFVLIRRYYDEVLKGFVLTVQSLLIMKISQLLSRKRNA